ncbi:uncharacterized protein [Drosophila tropicalis]|uniref:uncharacterized protein n=1 Tax=Drosophila tropicalis TaxID=46794 RepID=UPI0035ABB19D
MSPPKRDSGRHQARPHQKKTQQKNRQHPQKSSTRLQTAQYQQGQQQLHQQSQSSQSGSQQQAMQHQQLHPTDVEQPRAQQNAQSSQEWVKVGPSRSSRKPKAKISGKLQKSRPEALLIQANEGLSYSQVLERVTRRTDGQLDHVREHVMRVRRTAKDGLLLELRKCTADTTQSLKEAISQVLGEEAGVKALTRHKAVAIHGMDEQATPQELVAKLADQAKVEATSLRVRSFRSSFRNTMSAVVCAPEAVALKLLEVGRWCPEDAERRQMTQPHLKFLQLNLNHCIAAQDLLQQTVRELSANIALLSEPYRVGESGRWAKAACGKAAIWCCGSNVLVMQDVLSADGFVRARIGRNWVYSCYLAPSLSLERFGSILDSISNDARGRQGLIIGGDFNAWATEWGSTRTDARGRILLEGFANLSISLLNVGTQHTFRRAGTGSVVDLSYASDSIAASAVWSVGVAYSASDHEIVTFSVGRNRQPTARTLPLRKSFKVDAFNPLLFAESLEGLTECPNTNAEEAANLIMSRLDEACVASMAQRGSFSRHHTPVCWWNEAIADARRACLRARRLYQRARHSLNFEALGLEYRRRRKALKVAIRDSKRECFLELCDLAEQDPWGKAYQTVVKRVHGNRQSSP